MGIKTLLLSEEDMLFLLKSPERRIFKANFRLPDVKGSVVSFCYGSCSGSGYFGEIRYMHPEYADSQIPYTLDRRAILALEMGVGEGGA